MITLSLMLCVFLGAPLYYLEPQLFNRLSWIYHIQLDAKQKYSGKHLSESLWKTECYNFVPLLKTTPYHSRLFKCLLNLRRVINVQSKA